MNSEKRWNIPWVSDDKSFGIFDYDKAREFCVDWPGFIIDWEDRPDNAPIYLQISPGNIVLNLSEYHVDCSPGARVYIDDFEGLKAYHKKFLAKDYKFNRPDIENHLGEHVAWM